MNGDGVGEIDLELILRAFAQEAQDHLCLLEEGLVALEARADDAELLNSLFRSAHTLKGSAAVVGCDGIVGFAHTLEDALERLRRGALAPSPEAVTALLNAVDGLRRALPAALEGSSAPQPEHAVLEAFLRAQDGEAPLAAPAPAAPAPAPLPEGARPTLRVEIDKLDRMLGLTGELAVARGRLTAMLDAPERFGMAEIRDAHRDADRLHLDLQELVMRARMVSLGPVLRQHLRTVRDLALACGKQARLVLEGTETEVDTAIVEGLRALLTHLVRNAVDHGLEPPEARRAAGKDPVGTLSLRAGHEDGRVVVEVRDDGRGLDRTRIAARARELGLAEPGGDEALFELLFRPGFSTAAALTERSGRGVGLDAVRRGIEALHGTVRLANHPEGGTVARIELPLTLAIIEGFSVRVGDQTCVLPLDAVIECVDLPAEQRREAGDRGVISLRGEPLPYLRLSRVFGWEGEAGDRASVVVVRHGEGRAGLAVEALLGDGQVVIKPLSRLFRGARGVVGAALLGDGRVALILDVSALIRAAIDGGSPPADAGAVAPPAD